MVTLTEDDMATGNIYTTSDGNVRVRFLSLGVHGGHAVPTVDPAWREKEDCSRELVWWRNENWMTDTEINTARVEARTFR